MLQKITFQFPRLKFSGYRNMIIVFLLFLSCFSLQAQMYIGKDVVISLEGNSSLASDTIIIDSGSKTISTHTLKKAGNLYILSGNDGAFASLKTSSELSTKNEKVPEKEKDEFLGEEKSKQIVRANIPNPKPEINYTSHSCDDFKLKSEQILSATAGNPTNIGKKAVAAINFKKKIERSIFSPTLKKNESVFLNTSHLSIYLKFFRSRPPPFSAFI